MKHLAPVTVLCIAATLALGACGGGSGDDDQAAKPLSLADSKNAKGTATFCVGKDTTGAISESIDRFNSQSKGAKAELLELPESQDEARAQVVQRLRAKSSECDVIGMDPTWVAEFAAQGWLRDVTPAAEELKRNYIPSTLASARYQGQYWGLPYVTDTGFLYYRTDMLDEAPKTWNDAYEAARKDGGLVYQGARYEGLTCSFLELLWSAGGDVLSADGKEVAIDSPEARKAVEFMVTGVEDGAVPRAVTTYMEEEARRAFEGGHAALMRNWPYAYALGQKSEIKDKFAVMPVPGFGAEAGASVLGGYDLGVSSYSKDPGAALAFAVFMGGEEAQRIAGERSFPPTRSATYDDPAVRKALPFASQLRDAVRQARPRPVSPVYPQISTAIQKHVYEALQGGEDPDTAVKGMAADIEKALNTF